MEEKFKIGEEVTFKEELTTINYSIIIQDINDRGWIWSDQLPSPYRYELYNRVRNYYNPEFFKKTISQVRQDILNKIIYTLSI